MNKYLKKIVELDAISKSIIILMLVVFSYILIICLIIPLMLSQSNGFSEEYILSFGSPEHRHINLISFLLALSVGAVFALVFREQTGKEDNEIKIIKNVLSEADRQAISILEEVGEITQDSLTFRLEWSRAKVSTILTNLEKRNIIQRRREGKTYTVFLTKKIKK